MNERYEAFRRKVYDYTAGWLEEDKPGELNNEDLSFEKLLRINHYNHILNLMGDNGLKEDIMYLAYGLAKEKVMGMKNKSDRSSGLARLNVIALHTSAWNIAHFHYERAIKTLCMMMVTLMDNIIRELGGSSVLYNGLDETKYFDLLDEITSLNETYRIDYINICAFDFCTKKLGEYLDIPEYSYIAREHNRVINNGNPKRVQQIIDRLRDLCSGGQSGIIGRIQEAYTPEPVYSEDLFEQCYADAMGYYQTEDNAVQDFNGLVARVSNYYLISTKGPQNDIDMISD